MLSNLTLSNFSHFLFFSKYSVLQRSYSARIDSEIFLWSDCLIIRFDDIFCRYCSVAPLYTGATRGKSPTWLDWPSLTGQIMENRNQGRSRKNGASPIRLIIRRLLWMTSREKVPLDMKEHMTILLCYDCLSTRKKWSKSVSICVRWWLSLEQGRTSFEWQIQYQYKYNGKYKCDKLSCQTSWRNGADPVWRVVQADWRFDQQVFFWRFSSF